MTIHTVQQGDTINSIADEYNIPYTRLEQDNNLPPNSTLINGQALMITHPEQTYIVQNGDTLASIADTYGVTLIQLLRNNPQLSDREAFSLEVGEELVISYNNKDKKIKVNGFANSFINSPLLKKTLPFLTYITILNYRVTDDGRLVDIADTDVIQMSKEYGVAPLMFISTLDERGIGSYGVTHNILNNQEIQSHLIDNTLSMLKLKGYYGLYLGFQQILPEDLHLYVDFIATVTNLMNQEGFEVFVSLIPTTLGYKSGVPYENSYFYDIGQATNNVTLITYQWTSAYIAQVNETSANYLKEYLDFAVSQIPPEKIFIGLTRIAYDWELPYVEGETLGRFLTTLSAITLAEQVSAPIEFDEVTQTPYFYYNSLGGVEHFVWFKDARTFDAIINLVFEYGLKGVAVWNIMYYNTPTWLVINSQYEIESGLNNTSVEIT